MPATHPGQDVNPNIPIPPPVNKPTAPQDSERSDPPPPPPSLEEIRTQLVDTHRRAKDNLTNLRKNRDRINDQIRKAVAEEAELDRMVKALSPRTKTVKTS